jgi:hypothetical protein
MEHQGNLVFLIPGLGLRARQPEALLWPTICVTGVRAGLDNSWGRENSKREKCLKMRRIPAPGARSIGWVLLSQILLAVKNRGTLIIRDNNAIWSDFAFGHLECHRERAIGK